MRNGNGHNGCARRHGNEQRRYQPPSFELDPGAFYTYFYNHAHRPRLQKLVYLELLRSPSELLKALLDPGGGFTSETVARRFQK